MKQDIHLSYADILFAMAEGLGKHPFEKYSECDLARQTGSRIDMENGVLGIADDRGFTLQSKNGKFVFKPYLLLQTRGQLNYYDDEGLDKAYNQDNVANSGFAMPYAILGFTGKTFGRLDYNLSINAAATGGNVLQQAWVDYRLSPAARFRAGKFKTPFFHAYLTTLGETLFPSLPTSLTASTIMPYSLNAVTPSHRHRLRPRIPVPRQDEAQQEAGQLDDGLRGGTLERQRQRREHSHEDAFRRLRTSPRCSMPDASPSCPGARCLPRRATATCSPDATCSSG